MVSDGRHLCSIRILLLSLLMLVILGSVNRGLSQDLVGQAGLIGPDGRINLRILITTSSKAGRTDDFVKFLSERFVKVATTDYASFREENARGFDVVIIDYGTTRPGSPVPRQLSRDYSRATVTMGVAGAEVGGRLGLKTGYL